MNRFLILSFILLASCSKVTLSDQSITTNRLTLKKVKQKIAVLNKKREFALKEYQKTDEEVKRLSHEIYQAELTVIRNHIDTHEKSGKKGQEAFLDERETLYRIIQSGLSPSAFQAEMELDRILRIITEASDSL